LYKTRYLIYVALTIRYMWYNSGGGRDMLAATKTVQEVARLKGMTEAGVRFALNDPDTRSLVGIKCGGRLLVLDSSVATYVPRKYPCKESVVPWANTRQKHILKILEALATEMVEENATAARLLRACYPGGDVAQAGVPGYQFGFWDDDISLDGLRTSARSGSFNQQLVFGSDDDTTIMENARSWALRLVNEGWVEPKRD
jgi:hypothetical protein